jgi:hypothetical protein
VIKHFDFACPRRISMPLLRYEGCRLTTQNRDLIERYYASFITNLELSLRISSVKVLICAALEEPFPASFYSPVEIGGRIIP